MDTCSKILEELVLIAKAEQNVQPVQVPAGRRFMSEVDMARAIEARRTRQLYQEIMARH